MKTLEVKLLKNERLMRVYEGNEQSCFIEFSKLDSNVMKRLS